MSPISPQNDTCLATFTPTKKLARNNSMKYELTEHVLCDIVFNLANISNDNVYKYVRNV